MAQTMPLGISDFKEVRERGSFYVDKTRLISDLISDHSKVILLPRPRRFGKTLNLTMLREFFDDQSDNRSLFEGLAVSEDLTAMTQLGAFPVIYVTFKDLKPLSWASCNRKLVLLVGEMFRDHRQRLVSAQLYQDERDLVNLFIADHADLELCQNALALLSKMLYRITGKRVVLLIDEYDSPIHAGYQHGFREEIVGFMRDFLSGGLKDNSALEKGVLTGILRVAKDSIFSGLNNPSVYTILDRPYSTHFGFTEAEVQAMLVGSGLASSGPEVRRWYNGYRFGAQTIYNPWSILSVFRDPEAPFMPHWINTADNTLIRNLVVEEQAITLAELTTLLAGGSVHRAIDPFVALNDLKPASVWGLMLLSGYLTLAVEQPDLPMRHALRIPNLEVKSFFASTVNHWLGQQTHVDALMDSLLREDLLRFEALLTETVVQVLSYHDTAGRDSERVYHAFLAGLMVNLQRSHQIISNRESGHGRFDLVLLPRQTGQLGFIFEFKRGEIDQLEDLAGEALAQIDRNDYEALFRNQGVTRIRKIGLAFCGKRVTLASSVEEPELERHLALLPPLSPGNASQTLALEKVSTILQQPHWRPFLDHLLAKGDDPSSALSAARLFLGMELGSLIPQMARFLSGISATSIEISRAWQEGLGLIEWLMITRVDDRVSVQLNFNQPVISLPVSTHLGVEVVLAFAQRRQPRLERIDGQLRSPYALNVHADMGSSLEDFLSVVAQEVLRVVGHKVPPEFDSGSLRVVDAILKGKRLLDTGFYLVVQGSDQRHPLNQKENLKMMHAQLPNLTVVLLQPASDQPPLLLFDEHEMNGFLSFWIHEMKVRSA